MIYCSKAYQSLKARITLVQSPNLNLIERVWKWLKKDCLNCKYYSKFCEFKEAIDNSLNKIKTGQAQKEMDSLLTLNFQLFK